MIYQWREDTHAFVTKYGALYEVQRDLGMLMNDVLMAMKYKHPIMGYYFTRSPMIEIDLQKVIENHGLGEDDVDEFFERCDDKYECVFDEIMGDYYEKPEFSIDDRWTPDVNESYFNEILNDYLGDVRM
jgi:hypothetical protein